jgi:hypothetical protein
MQAHLYARSALPDDEAFPQTPQMAYSRKHGGAGRMADLVRMSGRVVSVKIAARVDPRPSVWARIGPEVVPLARPLQGFGNFA